MNFDTSTLMMIFFLIALIVSIWKIYAFLPNKELEDDDRTDASEEELLNIVLDVIKNNEKSPSLSELFQKIKDHKDFDSKHFWRFNQNRLQQLLNSYYLKNKNISTIDDIYYK